MVNGDTNEIERCHMNSVKISKLFDKITSAKMIHESTLLIENTGGDYSICKEYNRTIDTPMLMASITKLFTTTCVLALIEEGKISLEDKIVKYLGEEIVRGLHIYKGQEYSGELTISHLLFQNSGLPDYYLDGVRSVFSKVKKGDFAYSFADELTWIKGMKAHFRPGTPKKAYYTDANFDLLGKIIEIVKECTLKEAYETYIIKPLGLSNTYLPTHENEFIPHTYFKNERLERPQFICSSFASGGGVTTAREMMLFLKAFYNGKLFDKAIFSRLEGSNPLQLSFWPIHYAGGYMTITASYPFGEKVKLVGHCGSTGSFAFYSPQKDLFIVGDLAQIASPSSGIRLVMQVALSV